MRRNGLSLLALGAVLAIVGLALAAPLVAPYDPNAPNAEDALQAPGFRHWLGTDIYGRDQFSRIVWAARVDLLVALAATTLALTTGCVGGALAGYRGGLVDQVVMRLVDTIMAFPAFILARLRNTAAPDAAIRLRIEEETAYSRELEKLKPDDVEFRQLLEEFARSEHEDNYKADGSFFEKLRAAFR